MKITARPYQQHGGVAVDEGRAFVPFAQSTKLYILEQIDANRAEGDYLQDRFSYSLTVFIMETLHSTTYGHALKLTPEFDNAYSRQYTELDIVKEMHADITLEALHSLWMLEGVDPVRTAVRDWMIDRARQHAFCKRWRAALARKAYKRR